MIYQQKSELEVLLEYVSTHISPSRNPKNELYELAYKRLKVLLTDKNENFYDTKQFKDDYMQLIDLFDNCKSVARNDYSKVYDLGNNLPHIRISRA